MREIEFRARLLKRAGDKAKGEWVYGLPQQHVEIGGVPNPNKPPKIGYIVTWEPERGLQSGAPDDDLYPSSRRECPSPSRYGGGETPPARRWQYLTFYTIPAKI